MDKSEFYRRVRNIVVLSLVLFSIGIVLLILAKKGIMIPCVFNKFTGLECPGCGNTRAVIALARLDFKKAFFYNPIFPLEFFYIGWVYVIASINYMKGKCFSYQPPIKLMDIIFLAVFLLWGIIRNF